jgi:hypothetical protein
MTMKSKINGVDEKDPNSYESLVGIISCAVVVNVDNKKEVKQSGM